jgi:hypothetical protein
VSRTAKKREPVITEVVVPADIRALWLDASAQGPHPGATTDADLAKLLNAVKAVAPDRKAERDRQNATAAIRTLSQWCLANRAQSTPQRQADLAALEMALHRGRYLLPLAGKAPAWTFAARQIWDHAGALLEGAGGVHGIGPASVAVRFTFLALRRIGFPGVTEAAVSKAARTYREIVAPGMNRRRVSNAPVQLTP